MALEQMFATDGFVTRDQCGPGWTTALIAVYVAANALTALAYYSIPAALLWLWRERGHVLPRAGVLPAFAAFILLCGSTHVANVVVFRWPAYRFFAALDVATALVSAAVAVSLPAAVRYVALLPSPEEYRQAIARANETESELHDLLEIKKRSLTKLNAEVRQLREMVVHLEWRQATTQDVQAMRQHLHAITNAAMGAA